MHQRSEAGMTECLAGFLKCLRSPAIRNTVTFQHFLALIDRISAKLDLGETADAELAEVIALKPAIEAEMRILLGGISTQ